MRFGFLNNFATQIAAPVAETDTTLELSSGADLIAAALQDADAVALTLFVVDAQGVENKREVVYATAVTTGMVTVERGREGSLAQTFNPGDQVEARLTAEVLYAGMEPGFNADGDQVRIGASATVIGTDSIAIGKGASADAAEALSVGSNAAAIGLYSVCIGAWSEAYEEDSVVVGSWSYVYAEDGVALGCNCTAQGEASTAVGGGSSTYAEGNHSIAVGSNSNAYGAESVSLGDYSRADQTGSVAIGAGSFSSMAGGLQINATSYLPKEKRYFGASGGLPEVAKSSSQQVVIATDTINLTDNTQFVELGLLPNTILLPDALDVVVVEANGAGGAPEIQIGPDDITPAAYLAATPVTKTAVGGRETHTPLVTDGITALRVSVVTAGTGTAYKIKVVMRGYVMEV